MSKHIIELKDDVQMVQKVGVAKNGNAFVMNFYKDQLEELTADYINEHYGDLQDEAYQRGLEDAWEAARKIADMWETMDNDDLLETFGVTAKIGESVIGTLFKKQTANEAMLVLEAYEEKQKTDDEIKVGDEVETEGGKKYVVVSFGKYKGEEVTACGFNADGCWRGMEINTLRKTGNHFDISSILKEMQS